MVDPITQPAAPAFSAPVTPRYRGNLLGRFVVPKSTIARLVDLLCERLETVMEKIENEVWVRFAETTDTYGVSKKLYKEAGELIKNLQKLLPQNGDPRQLRLFDKAAGSLEHEVENLIPPQLLVPHLVRHVEALHEFYQQHGFTSLALELHTLLDLKNRHSTDLTSRAFILKWNGAAFSFSDRYLLLIALREAIEQGKCDLCPSEKAVLSSTHDLTRVKTQLALK